MSTLAKETASQTAGPYVHIGLAPAVAGLRARDHEISANLAGPNAFGEAITLEGVVFDGQGAPVLDALIEIWQADANGIYASPLDPRNTAPDPDFRGVGRISADLKTGLWSLRTIKPGQVPAGDGLMAPHINLIILARGINIHLSTRVYFDDETSANAADPVLNLPQVAPRRATLLARRSQREGRNVYRFDIALQGENETVFFDV